MFEMDKKLNTSDLPPEILEMVFQLLPPLDLQSAVMVCRRWRNVGGVPKLWRWFCLRVTRDNLSIIPDIMKMKRLGKFFHIKIKENDDLVK